MQPQTWASGGVEGSIERSKKILKQCDTNEPLLRARVRAAQERMNTAAGEERRAAHAVSSKASFSAQMATMKKRVIDANPGDNGCAYINDQTPTTNACDLNCERSKK